MMSEIRRDSQMGSDSGDSVDLRRDSVTSTQQQLGGFNMSNDTSKYCPRSLNHPIYQRNYLLPLLHTY